MAVIIDGRTSSKRTKVRVHADGRKCVGVARTLVQGAGCEVSGEHALPEIAGGVPVAQPTQPVQPPPAVRQPQSQGSRQNQAQTQGTNFSDRLRGALKK